MTNRTFSRRALLTAAMGLMVPLALRAASDPLNVIDGTGRQVSVGATPRRIIVLTGPGYVTLATLGVRPIGVSIGPTFTERSTYLFERASEFAIVTGLGGQLDLEKIVALEPDLIIGSQSEELAALEGSIPIYYGGFRKGLRGIYEEVRTLGALLDAAPRAETAIAAFERDLDTYRARAPRNRNAVIAVCVSPTSFWIFTQDVEFCEIASALLGKTGIDYPTRNGWINAGIESLLYFNPDTLILVDYSPAGEGARRAELSATPLWSALKAVQHDQVFFLDGRESLLLMGLPTASRLLDQIATKVYPDLFPKPMHTDIGNPIDG